MGFYQVVTTIAAIVLIICLTFTGYMLWTSMHKSDFPPTKSTCPDFWQAVGKDGKIECKNVKNLGTCCTQAHPCSPDEPLVKSFNSNHWKSSDRGPCRKKQWADECGLSWSGYTNNDSVCEVDHPSAF